MTEPQTPATEARRRFRRWVFNEINGGDFGDVWTQEFDRLLDAIEAAARADAEGELALCRRAEDALQQVAEAWKKQAETARADALREAAERVRALDGVPFWEDGSSYLIEDADGHYLDRAAVLAILDPQP